MHKRETTLVVLPHSSVIFGKAIVNPKDWIFLAFKLAFIDHYFMFILNLKENRAHFRDFLIDSIR